MDKEAKKDKKIVENCLKLFEWVMNEKTYKKKPKKEMLGSV